MDDEVLLRPAEPAILPGIIFGEAADFEQSHGAIVAGRGSGIVCRSPINLFFNMLLTPVVDHIGIGAIEPLRMRTLHGDTLHRDPISAGSHADVGIFASRVHASLDRRAT